MTDTASNAAEPVANAVSPVRSDPSGQPQHPLHVTRLLAQAAAKSSVLWIRLPAGASYPVWFVWHDDGDPRGTGPALYVVSGPGEQVLPWLPGDVEVIFRSKDNGGRLLTTAAATREIRPDDPAWTAAVEVLLAERLNSPADLVERWRESGTIHVLCPHGRPVPTDDGPHTEVVEPGRAATASWRPWHWRGRPQSRRGTT